MRIEFLNKARELVLDIEPTAEQMAVAADASMLILDGKHYSFRAYSADRLSFQEVLPPAEFIVTQ